MSNKAAPLTITACMLLERSYHEFDTGIGPMSDPQSVHTCAALASDLHRLAPAAQRLAIAECNGEWREGQRDAMYRHMRSLPKEAQNQYCHDWQVTFEAECEAQGSKLDKRLEKLNRRLAPFALQVTTPGDPRGHVLALESTDKARPVGYDNRFPIVGKKG